MIIPGNDGPFEESFKTYFEDSDLSFRAKQLGMNLKIVPVPVVHFGKATTKKLGVQGLYESAKQKAKEKWKITG